MDVRSVTFTPPSSSATKKTLPIQTISEVRKIKLNNVCVCVCGVCIASLGRSDAISDATGMHVAQKIRN